MAVSKRLRYEILRRDNHACRYCGATAPDIPLTVDHVVPTALGGDDDPSNLVTACQPCNAGKSASSPDAPIVADVAADALRWARAMERAVQIQASQRQAEQDYFDAFANHWHLYEYKGSPLIPLESDHLNSLRNFYRAGLAVSELHYAADEAMGARHIPTSRVWRYFCGICWRLIEERREIATALIQAEETDGGA